ncbi:MAG: hypothetical protein IPI11_14850 [Haliscomenobacter sp.]|nr:hypothetical protein [Haliscomenobacter sp.]
MHIPSLRQRQRLLLLLFLGFTLAANAQDGKVVIGTIDTVVSTILNEQRPVWVYVPDGGGPNGMSRQRYPVVYLLDGDGHFSSVVGMIQQLSSVNGNTFCPKMIVVGIPNTDRTRDLTPTHVEADPPYMDSVLRKHRAAAKTLSRLSKRELMPHIEATYPAAPYKMLIGHSFGGLAVMQTLVHHTDLFNAYICIDPSMWWDNQKLLQQAQKALAEKKFEGKSLFLGIANTMEEGMDLKTVVKDTSGDTKHIRSILALQTYLEQNKQNGLKYQGKYYPSDTHGSAPLITTYDALRFFFDFFPFTLTMKDFTDSTSALAEKYQHHFDRLSQKMGYSIKPDEGEINYMGYEFLRQKHDKKAEDLFKLNVANHPESSNVYDSYADYFLAQQDTANAILQLKKALAISENEGSRKKLEALEGSGKAPRYLREVSLSGSGYALGLQHGQQLKKEIGEIVGKWKQSVESQLNQPADTVVKAFFEYARFDEAIKTWTPELYEEVRGIADGSGQAFNDIMVHNLLDEFWVWQDARQNHHCSGIGVPARDGNPGYIAQNMDLESYTDGYQVLLRLAKTDKTPEQLILTYPGCMATNGLNEAGIGACMNTLMQLKGAPTGLPVAFIVRRILNSTDKNEVLRFIQQAPHASGQNYILGIRGEVYDFEASANKVVRFDPKNANGTVYHTNHPMANDDLKDWYKSPEKGNSAIRLASVVDRIATLPIIEDKDIKDALRAKDDPNNPVCRAFNRWGGTFGSVVMTLTGNPKLEITAGPPDESEYKEVRFSSEKPQSGETGWRTITGTVVDEQGDPLIGTGIRVLPVENNRGTVNGIEGEYSLTVPPTAKELLYFYDAGYGPDTVALTESDTLHVMLVQNQNFAVALDPSKKPSQRTHWIRVTGEIRGIPKSNFHPVIRIVGTNARIVPDEKGRFELFLPPGSDILSLEAENFSPRQVRVPNVPHLHLPTVNLYSQKPSKRKKQ